MNKETKNGESFVWESAKVIFVYFLGGLALSSVAASVGLFAALICRLAR